MSALSRWSSWLLATLKAGGAYLPLDPATPKNASLSWLLTLGRPVLLTQQSCSGQVSALAANRPRSRPSKE